MDYPTPVKESSRIAFGIDYFESEEDADIAGKIIRERGDTYNGGWFHGMPCGRNSSFDYDSKELGMKLFAVTRR